MAPRSRDFFDARPAVPLALLDVFTVPPDRVAIVHTWSILNAGAVQAAFALSHVVGGVATVIARPVLDPNGFYLLPVKVYAREGQQLRVSAAPASLFHSYGGGSLLEGDWA